MFVGGIRVGALEIADLVNRPSGTLAGRPIATSLADLRKYGVLV
jgi:hypothetical protein